MDLSFFLRIDESYYFLHLAKVLLLAKNDTSSYKKQSLWKIKNDFLEKKKEKSYS